MKCENGIFYCPKDTSCHNGDLYFEQEGNKCLNCPASYFGDNCELNCHKGSYQNGKCTCPDPYYGDYCEKQCDTNKIYKDGNCVCDILYEPDGNGCKKIECVKGTLKDGKCLCSTGFTGTHCEIPICEKHEIIDGLNCKCKDGFTGQHCETLTCGKNMKVDNGSCLCLDNKDGTQYYQHNNECLEYQCRLSSQFKLDNGTPKCICDDSCGQFCEITRDKCNQHGTPNCVNNQFMNCNCDSGFTGPHCNCTSQKPSENKCKGETYYCGENGWTKNTYTDENDFYRKNGFSNHDDWYTNCFSANCPTLLSGTMSFDPTHIYECIGCPKDNMKTCSDGQVSLCDSSTNHQWSCKDVVKNTSCPPDTDNYYCMNNNIKNKPVCFHCDDKNSEWVCTNSGASPSLNCLTSAVGINIESNVIGSSRPIYYKTSGLVFKPTTDNDACEKYLDSYFNGKQINDVNNDPEYSGYNFKNVLGNPEGTYNQENKKFTPFSGNRYFNAIVGNYNDKCVYTDDMVKQYVMKTSDPLCNGGAFIQDQDKNGNLLPSGHCHCLSGRAGNNCQYSEKTCNGNGTVDENGNCTCNLNFTGTHCEKCVSPYKGKKCDFTDEKTCNGNGTVDENGKCTCSPIYLGDHCEKCDKKWISEYQNIIQSCITSPNRNECNKKASDMLKYCSKH